MSYSLRAFVGIWLLYFFLVAVAPAYSLTSKMHQAVVLDIFFVVLTLLVAVLTQHFLETNIRNDHTQRYAMPTGISRSILTVSILLALLGLLALMFDKIQIQHIDYSGELALAREKWRELGEGREGVSSMYSVMGYAFSTSFVVTLVPIMLKPASLSHVRIGITLCSLFLFLMLNSILTGGRTIILLALTFAFAFYSVHRERGGKVYTLSSGTKTGLMVLVALMTMYIFYVFMSRASATHDGVSASEYMEGMQEYMGLGTLAWPEKLESKFPIFGSIVAFGMLIITYLCHSIFIFAEYLQHQTEYDGDPLILFSHLRSLFSKLGILGSQSTDWFLAGRFPSLPGALFHDGGYFLLSTGALLLGSLTGCANFFARAKENSLLRIGFISSVYTVLFLSPLLFAPDLMSFPFIVLEFIMFGVLFSKFRITK